MTTIHLRVPFLRTCRIDDEQFAALGGEVLHCSTIDDDGTVDLTVSGSEAAVSYCCQQVRTAA